MRDKQGKMALHYAQEQVSAHGQHVVEYVLAVNDMANNIMI